MSIELISILVLFVSFFALLAYGVPVAYSIGLSTLSTMLLNIVALPAVTTVAQRMTTTPAGHFHRVPQHATGGGSEAGSCPRSDEGPSPASGSAGLAAD